MKLFYAVLAFVAMPLTAFANEIDATIFEANGCDSEYLVPVMSDRNPGEILYWHNTDGKGCKADRGDTEVAEPVVVTPKPVEPKEVALK